MCSQFWFSKLYASEKVIPVMTLEIDVGDRSTKDGDRKNLIHFKAKYKLIDDQQISTKH